MTSFFPLSSRCRPARLSVMLVLLLTTAGLASDPPERTHDIVIEDYFSIGGITGLSVSPDGRQVAYTEMRWEPPLEKRNTDLWVVEIGTGESRRLTFDRGNEGAPKWSADGRFIYFTGTYERAGEESPPYDGSKQVWRLTPEGGTPLAVTRVEDGIDSYDLARDGKAVYYVISTEKTDDEWKSLREAYSDLEYGHGVTRFSEIWKLDLTTWRKEKLVDERRVVKAMAVSPDQDRIAMITTPDEETIHKEGWSRVDVFDVGEKKVETVTDDTWRDDHLSPFGWLNEVAWSADSSALAFSVSFDGYPDRIYVAEWNGEETKTWELDRPGGVTVTGGSLKWRGNDRDLCFVGESRARAHLYTIPDVRDGGQGIGASSTVGDVTVESYAFSGDGEVTAVVSGSLTTPEDIYTVDRSGELVRLTRINPQVDNWKLPTIELVRWKSKDGREVEGILELPPDYKKEDGPLPMIVELHGGPTSATQYRFQFWIYGRTALAAKGYAMLSPNYRGSTGYGDDFMIELIGRENDIEVQDILTGVEAMIDGKIADPDRLGVMGWSNGGFLTNCLISRTNIFKAASSGAGVLDQVMQWGIEDTPGHVINYMEGNYPWADPDEYRAGSPLYTLGNAKTPTIIHVGKNDPRVPAEHSRALYRALRFYLKVPTELIVYPGAGHGLTEYDHRKAKMEWDHAWFDRYVLGKVKKKEKETE